MTDAVRVHCTSRRRTAADWIDRLPPEESNRRRATRRLASFRAPTQRPVFLVRFASRLSFFDIFGFFFSSRPTLSFLPMTVSLWALSQDSDCTSLCACLPVSQPAGLCARPRIGDLSGRVKRKAGSVRLRGGRSSRGSSCRSPRNVPGETAFRTGASSCGQSPRPCIGVSRRVR